MIVENVDSFDELVTVSRPMGAASGNNDRAKVLDLWDQRQTQIGQLRVVAFDLDEDLWVNGQALPVKRSPSDGPLDGRVRCTRPNPLPDASRPERVEGWLSNEAAARVESVADEVKAAQSLGYPMHAAHLFPATHGGPMELWNLIATSTRFNGSWMKTSETTLKALLKEHGEIYLRVDVVWPESGGNLPRKVVYSVYKRGDHGGPELLSEHSSRTSSRASSRERGIRWAIRSTTSRR